MHLRALVTTLAISASAPAFAWGPNGHHTIGALADKLIAGSHAASQVATILNGLSLQDAAVWADCAKGIDPTKNFQYQNPGTFPECAIFENPTEEAAMADFVKRNDTNCVRKPTEESCHKQYHYSDIAAQHARYETGLIGARNDDIVAAVSAAVRELKGESVPAPFSLKNKREALLLLAHYVGDIHQPLHVGAIYLTAAGVRVNPDAGTFDEATATRGGNEIMVTALPGAKPQNLHANWDAIPPSLQVAHISAEWIARAAAIPPTSGNISTWPTTWATESVKDAQHAFKGLQFTKMSDTLWGVTLPVGYEADANTIKDAQLTKAGARLAQILQAIFP